MTEEIKTPDVEKTETPVEDKSNIGPSTIKVTDAEKEKFFKSFLSDKPYEEDVQLFGGKVVATIRTFSVAEQQDIIGQIQMDQDSGIAESNDSYLTTILSYRLGVGLVAINGEPFAVDLTPDKVPKNKEKAYSYIRARYELFKKWPLYKLTSYVDSYGAFENKVQALTRQMTSPDFWKASA